MISSVKIQPEFNLFWGCRPMLGELDQSEVGFCRFRAVLTNLGATPAQFGRFGPIWGRWRTRPGELSQFGCDFDRARSVFAESTWTARCRRAGLKSSWVNDLCRQVLANILDSLYSAPPRGAKIQCSPMGNLPPTSATNFRLFPEQPCQKDAMRLAKCQPGSTNLCVTKAELNDLWAGAFQAWLGFDLTPCPAEFGLNFSRAKMEGPTWTEFGPTRAGSGPIWTVSEPS